MAENGSVSAYDVFIKNSRFDLIYKILYVLSKKKPSGVQEFYRKIYIEHIRAFNNFYECEPLKNSPEAFVDSFDQLVESIEKNGYDKTPIPIRENGNLANAAHRLACCVAMDIDVTTEIVDYQHDFNWLFFEKQGISKSVADFGALNYVELNKNAYIVNIFPVMPKKYDKKIESILEQYGFIYYRKELKLGINACINLKKINYGKEQWIGNYQNKFAGLRDHAEKSMGHNQNPLRVYVFVCDNIEKIIEAKKEIRSILNIGNFSIHINDFREEAIELAQVYFNENSFFLLNARHYLYINEKNDKFIDEFKNYVNQNDYDINEFCAGGSAPLGIFGIRENRDFDFLHIPNKINGTDIVSSHESYLKNYPRTKTDIILNPENHFYFKGIKFVSLETLKQMKQKRNEFPKDNIDVLRINLFLSRKHSIFHVIVSAFTLAQNWVKHCFGKIKNFFARCLMFVVRCLRFAKRKILKR